jgi:transposase
MMSSVAGQRLIRAVNREQMCWRAVDVERLIGDDHPARAIWDFVGCLDLRAYYERVAASEEVGGRPAFDPRLLISLWVYGYSVGIGSAREIARRCEWDPGFQWLTGCEVVNYHTLADFRVARRAELDETFTQVLGLLSAGGLITLEQVMQDGTKMKALASGKSFRKEQALRRHLDQVRQYVREMGEAEPEGESARVQAARERAGRERQQRLERAVAELENLQKRDASVSTSDPEARRMKQSDGGFAPSYNVQFSTDAVEGAIVEVDVVQDRNDCHQLMPAVERIEQRLGSKPKQMVADGGYTTRANIGDMQAAGVDFIGSLGQDAALESGPFAVSAFVFDEQKNCYLCPQGEPLWPRGWQISSGVRYRRYRAKKRQCQGCPQKSACCGRHTTRGILRPEPSAAVDAFREKMATEEAKAQYRKRSRVAEFCHAWIKTKFGLRQLHVRGLIKAKTEMLWAALTFNIQLAIRLT